MIGEGITKLAIKSLVGSTEKEKENALRLLINLSDNEAYCAKIASEKGAFLLLSSTAENLEYPTLSNLAEDVLKRLEVIDENVEHLAAAGRFEPLLSRLCEGGYGCKIPFIIFHYILLYLLLGVMFSPGLLFIGMA